jgi:hypothetical protein
MLHKLLAAVVFLGLLGCSGPNASSQNTPPCDETQARTGVAYDVAKSRFSFGGTPIETKSASIDQWTGPDGALGVFSNGYTLATLAGDAPEADLPPLLATSAMIKDYVTDYFVGLGVSACQIQESRILSLGEGSLSGDAGDTDLLGQVTVGLDRAIHGIPVVESIAMAEFDIDYQTTSETFYWPTIPSDVVSSALALQARTQTSVELASYKAKLPRDAQGSGRLLIHHTPGVATSSSFSAVAVYSVMSLNDGSLLSFDVNGQAVSLPN